MEVQSRHLVDQRTECIPKVRIGCSDIREEIPDGDVGGRGVGAVLVSVSAWGGGMAKV